MTFSNLKKTEENYPNWRKTLWEKEKFLLFPQCFQKASLPGVSKGVIVWEWVKQMTIFIFSNKSKTSLYCLASQILLIY